MPDYDARPPPQADAVDALLWVPRILTSPLYFVSEYVIRLPLGAIDTWVEQNDVPRLLFDFFRFGPEKNIAILPTAFYDFGFLPSVGLYAYWKGVGAPGHRISIHAATWGEDWLSFSLQDRVQIDSHLSFITRGHYLKRQDYLLGIDDPSNGFHTRTRYSSERMDAEFGYELRIQRSSLSVSGLVQRSTFGDTSFVALGQPSVVTYGRAHGGWLPVAFAEGYSLASFRTHAVFDTRDPSGVPSAGIRVEGRAELAGTFGGLAGSRWARLDGEVLAAADLLGGRRVLSIAADAAAILPFDGSPVPFDQTIDVGGLGPLTAFLPGELRGMSALSATLAYDWPIWVFINARIYLAAGGAFGERFDGLSLERMRMSFGVAVRPNDPGDHPFEVGLGFGTRPFEEGANVDTIRFFIGARNLL